MTWTREHGSLKVNENKWPHGTIESYTTGACRCEPCKAVATGYCNPNGVPMCNRLPDHKGRCSTHDKDRTLDKLAAEVMELNFPHSFRYYIVEMIEEYQS